LKRFDRKFGGEFLSGVPRSPGVYRFYDEKGVLLYVGKAKDLRRRLAQYRTTRRLKKDKKRRTLVDSAHRLEFEVCETELDASLLEIRLIQTLSPSENIAGAFPFLYPFVGVHTKETDVFFCFTTASDGFPQFRLHGAFRSRYVAGEAFFSLMRLLKFIGHPIPRTHCEKLGKVEHSYLFGFRRLPPDAADLWERFFRGQSREALESLSLRLLECAAARAKSADIQEDLKALKRFFDEEATELALAIEATGYSGYPVPQRHRDPLFLEYRGGKR
jgi:hypothetical protein